MEYPTSIFCTIDNWVTTIDAIKVEERNSTKVYHTEDGGIRAVSLLGNSGTILTKDGKTKPIDVQDIRRKNSEHEIHIVGGNYSATSCTMYYYGNYNGKIDSPFTAYKIMINETTVEGEATYGSEWDWNVISEGNAEAVEKNALSFNKDSVSISLADEIESFMLVQDIL